MADGEYRRLTCSAAGCDGTHKAQGYCLRHYRQWQRGGIKQDATNCAHCGQPFTPSKVGAMYCSRRCNLAAWRAANPERLVELKHRRVSSVHAGYCVTCGSAYVSRFPRKYCGPKCEPKAVYVSQAPESKVCKGCGKSFATEYTGGKMAGFCGDECRSQAVARHKRVQRLKRKASVRAAKVESVDPIRVFDRDRWRCCLCGVKTPKARRGTYADNAPELDHIVPLSKGGEHSYRNTQCACRRCNGAKSDATRGQLLLIG